MREKDYENRAEIYKAKSANFAGLYLGLLYEFGAEFRCGDSCGPRLHVLQDQIIQFSRDRKIVVGRRPFFGHVGLK